MAENENHYEEYRELATSVVKFCVVDYLGALKYMYTYDHPDATKTTRKKAKSMYNVANAKVKNRYRKYIGNDDMIRRLTLRELDSEYYAQKAIAKGCENFFESQLFELYSQGADGDGFIKATKHALKRWLSGVENPLAAWNMEKKHD